MEINLKVGDIVLGGKFKNKRQEVKKLGTDKIGQPTYNKGKKLLAVRIEKTLPHEYKSQQTRLEMNKQALLEDVYNSAFEDELEKVASDREMGERISGGINVPASIASLIVSKDLLKTSKGLKEFSALRKAIKYGVIPASLVLGAYGATQIIAPKATKNYFKD